ncbi:MAG TPA: tetratricopeptide repeat protein [Candidatus Angelobacter sp.]|jgi:tetratricopeptide (TPR) repeat protein|nr:tetratricopeptide repeat protein [Candidatus Angelobacter sp.]
MLSLVSCALFALGLWTQQPSTPSTGKDLAISFSTQSVDAREALQRGVVEWENHRMADAVSDFRKATQADENFAVAHLFLSALTPKPEEQSSELQKALALSSSASEAEQMLIRWLASTSQNQILPAIVSMNELLARYPQDEHLLYRAAIWFRGQRQTNRAIASYERLLQIDPKFADALNQLGYVYAFEGNFDKAIATMKKYVAALPKEPNPEDSYAEILRMAGHYKDALAHYHRALAIDHSFWSSQEGIAGTYSLMGDQARARAEYETAIQHAPSQSAAIQWTMNSAVTWIRQNDFTKANAVLHDIAQRAHENNLAELESSAFRQMALFEKDPAARQELLTRAESALHHDHPLSKLASEQQTAQIMRARIYAFLEEKDLGAANRILDELHSTSEDTHNGFIRVVFHGANGAVLTMEGKYEDAIGELLEDDRNLFSMKYLAMAYQKSGATQEASRWAARLAGTKNPTLEQALLTAAPSPVQPAKRIASK